MMRLTTTTLSSTRVTPFLGIGTAPVPVAPPVPAVSFQLPPMAWGMCDMGGARGFATKKADKKPVAPAKKPAPKIEEEEPEEEEEEEAEAEEAEAEEDVEADEEEEIEEEDDIPPTPPPARAAPPQKGQPAKAAPAAKTTPPPKQPPPRPTTPTPPPPSKASPAAPSPSKVAPPKAAPAPVPVPAAPVKGAAAGKGLSVVGKQARSLPKTSHQPGTIVGIPLKLPPAENLGDDEVQEYFNKCKDKLGFVPNVLRAYSHNMKRLKNFINLYNELMSGESTLTKLDRELIAVTVSSENRCYYCLVAHGAAVRSLSGDPALGELAAFNYRVANLTSKQKAMLNFASALARAPHLVTEEDRAKLKNAGFNPTEIWDICEIVGLFSMTNRVASGADIMPNPEYHSQGR